MLFCFTLDPCLFCKELVLWLEPGSSVMRTACRPLASKSLSSNLQDQGAE